MTKKQFRTLQDYRDAGVLDRKPSPYEWVALAKDGRQFSIHRTESEAIAAAERIGGSRAPYKPIESTYWNGTQHYDH